MGETDTIRATGRRKTAVAKVILQPGAGKFSVNDQAPEKYFHREILANRLKVPFDVTGSTGKFDVTAQVVGGGKVGQAGALVHGLARALVLANPAFRPSLKSSGLLTRDPRKRERKKYGQPGARKRFQFSKR